MKLLITIIISGILFFPYTLKAKEIVFKEINENVFYYNLNIVNSNNGLEFHVELKYKRDSIHKVLLPWDYYGTPDLHQWVKSFEVSNGTQIIKAGSNYHRISPNLKGEVYIKYQIKYDSKLLDNYSYAPNVSNSFFYMAGCQWMLPIYPLDQITTFNISINGDDPNWILYSSLSENVNEIELESSYEDLISAGFGGNKNPDSQVTFNLEGMRYSVFINGDFNFDKKLLFKQLKEILRGEKEFFEDHEQSFYYITILPRTGLLAGASIPHLFYCFVDTKESSENIQDLISHEYFHNWLPNKMYLPTLKGEYDFKHEWFHEGFTEYFSRTILFEKEIITKKQYAELFNKDILSILNNPSANESYLKLASRNNLGAAQKKLSYYRGPLIALRWDYQLSTKGSSLKEMMLFLYEISKENNGKISYQDIFEFGNKFSLNFNKDFEDFIMNGKNIPAESNSFKDYQLISQTVKLFDPGFDVLKSSKDKIIQGVNPNGPAYLAGLRNGMTYVKRKNSNRWSNSWSELKPYIVTVIDNENEKAIAFYPYGKTVDVKLFKDYNSYNND